MTHVIVLILGFVLLVWGADSFVEGASSFARKKKIPSLIVGLTIVAFGTSAPELAVSVVASLQGANEIVIGNVVGSNIFNLLMVVGCSAMMAPLVVEKDILHRDWIISNFGVGLVCIILYFYQVISRISGILLLFFFSIIVALQLCNATKNKVVEQEEEVRIKNKVIFIKITLGLSSIILGGQCAVHGASELARLMNISDTIIGLTVVAIGTSLPELVTSVVATRKGEKSIAVGNVIGSNIFNIFFILGISSLVNPINVVSTVFYDALLLFIISILYLLLARKVVVSKKIGLSMIVMYALYTIWIIVR